MKEFELLRNVIEAGTSIEDIHGAHNLKVINLQLNHAASYTIRKLERSVWKEDLNTFRSIGKIGASIGGDFLRKFTTSNILNHYKYRLSPHVFNQIRLFDRQLETKLTLD